MNFDKLFAWITIIVLGFSTADNLDTLQRWVLAAQSKVIAESKTSNWGSPRFFPNRNFQNSSIHQSH